MLSNEQITENLPTLPGTPFAGGFYAGREKMRKVVEWKRRNADGSHSEVHFINADYHTAGFSIVSDGVSWRVVNVPDVGHMFVEEE